MTFFTEQEYEFIIHTSFNHLWDKKNLVPTLDEKYRIIIPMREYCPSSDFKIRIPSFKDEFFFADPSGFSLTHSFYFPIKHPDRLDTFKLQHYSGKWFDWRELKPQIIQQKTAHPHISYKLTGELLQSDELNTIVTFEDGSQTTILGLYRYPKNVWHNTIFAPRPGNGTGTLDGSFIVGDGFVIIHDFARNTNIRYQVVKVKKVYSSKYNDDSDGEELEPFNICDYFPKSITQKPHIEPLEISIPSYWVKDQGTYIQNDLNVEYLPDAAPDLLEKGIVFIKSPKGTGKTDLLIDVISRCKFDYQETEGVLVIGHRVNLLYNISERLGLTHYRDVAGVSRFFALSLDSLAKRLEGSPFNHRTIIIDEIEQVLNHLTSSTLKKERKQIFCKFVQLIQNAERIILLDADLSYELTIEIIKLFRGDKFRYVDDIQAIINTYPVGQGREIEMFATRDQLLTDLITTLNVPTDGLIRNISEEGSIYSTPGTLYKNRVFITTNSIKLCKEIELILLEKIRLNEIQDLKPEQILVVHSESAEEPLQKEFIRFPKKESKKYKVVISSPTMNTGVSIDGNHFNHNYGFFCPMPFNAYDRDQAMARNRNKKAKNKVWMTHTTDVDYIKHRRLDLMKICVENDASSEDAKAMIDKMNNMAKEKRFLENEEDQINFFNYKREGFRKIELKTRIRINSDISFNEDEELWILTLATLETVDAIRMKNVYEKYVALCESNGYVVVQADDNLDNHLQGQLDFKSQKYEKQVEDAKNILSVPSIDGEQASRYEQSHNLTRTEHYQLRKFNIQMFLHELNLELTEELVIRINSKRMLAVNYLLETMLKPKDSLLVLDDNQRKPKERGYVVTDFHHYTLTRGLLDSAVECMKIPNITTFEHLFKTTKESIVIDKLNIFLFTKFVDENLFDINKSFGSRLKKSDKKLKSIWDAMFGSVGILINYNKKKKIYSTDVKTFDIVLQKQRGEVYTSDQLFEMRIKKDEQWKEEHSMSNKQLAKLVKL